MTSRVCEEFNCPPDVAGRQDYNTCLRIMELRGYSAVKRAIESATKDNPPPEEITKSPTAKVWEQVMRIRKSGGVS